MAGNRQFGSIRKLPSGRFQARYVGPDDARHRAPTTFPTKKAADGWLASVRVEIDAGTWRSPAQRQAEEEAAAQAATATRTTLREYSEQWLASRMVKGRPLADNTRWGYSQGLRDHIYPVLGDTPIASIDRAAIRDWHAELCPGAPTARARNYDLLRAILNSAVDDELIDANPVRIRGASTVSRASKTVPATADQIADLTAEIPAQWQLTITLATWCTLRVGELLALQRRDVTVDPAAAVPYSPVVRVTVEKTVVQDRERGGRKVVGGAKSGSEGAVVIPPHVVRSVWEHLDTHVRPAADAWLFASARDPHLALSKGTLYDPWFYRARTAAGRPDLRFHDLRHTGNLYAAESGATLAELMERMRHRTVRAALKYLHAAKGSDVRLAQRMSASVAPTRTAPVALPPSAPEPAQDPVEEEVQRRVQERLRELGIDP